MTAKTDEGGEASIAADPSSNPDRVSAPAGVPSIIVDPSIASEAAAEQSAPAAAHAANGNGGEPPKAASGTEANVADDVSDRLSVEDADRFAASFRPSWEPPAPVPSAPAPAARAPDLSPRSDEVARVPRSRKSGVLLTLGAVSSFVGLGVLALFSSRHAPPPSWEGVAPQAAKKPEPVAPPPVAVPAAPVVEAAPVAATPVVSADPSALPVAPMEPLPPVAPTDAPVDVTAPAAPAEPALAAAAPLVEAAPVAAPEPASPPEAPPQPPTAAVAIAQPAPEPAPPAAPKMVKVRISATPSEAELSLDGQAIPNPFEADVIISGKHRVQAKAHGHRSADVTVPFDQPQELALRLERLEPAKPRASRRTRSAPTPPRPAPAPQKPASADRGAGFVSESPY